MFSNFFINLKLRLYQLISYQPNIIYTDIVINEYPKMVRALHIPTDIVGYGKDKTAALYDLQFNIKRRFGLIYKYYD